MKALVYTGNCTLELQNWETPKTAKGQYLVKIVANGICGSDVEGLLGKSGRRTPPMVMGHEFAGVIEEAPRGGKFTKGQRVLAFPKLYCGSCEICKEGLVNICPDAPFLGAMSCNGTMCEYITIDETYIIPFGDHISFEAASLVEPLAVAVRGVENIPQETLQRASRILVLGAGTIGLLAIQALRLKGFSETIVANDMSEFRLQKARGVGADITCTSLDNRPDTSQFDIVIECVGLEVTAQSSLQVLKSGGTAIWIGNNQPVITMNMQKIVTGELKIFGSYTYTLQDFMQALEYIEQQKIMYKPIITSSMPLEQGVEAFDKLLNNKDGKEIKIILHNGSNA